MSESTNTPSPTTPLGDVEHHLTYLKLTFMAQHYAELATQAAQKMWPHVDYLARLLEEEDRRDGEPVELRTHPGQGGFRRNAAEEDHWGGSSRPPSTEAS